MGLAQMNSQWVEGAMVHIPHRRVILDLDSPVHGQQRGAAYNGHFECVCYHPRPELGCIPKSGGQDGVAPGRVVSQSGLHRHQPELSSQGDSPLLQWPRHGGAVDKGRQVRPELDPAFLPQVRGQQGEAGTLRTGLQHGQLHEKAGVAGGYEALVADQSANQADQDGRLVRHARRLVFQLAEVLVSREMLGGILERIGQLRLAPG